MAALKDELGDLLLQVVFHARMAEEAGLFGFEDVAAAIADKMERRHPHVFGDAEIASVAAQNEAWEAHKAAEREARRRCGKRARRRGARPARAAARRQDLAPRGADRLRLAGCAMRSCRKIDEEIAEIEAELDGARRPAALEEEVGDLLFAAANLARKLDIEPETALRRATAKFERRFRARRGAGATSAASAATSMRSKTLWQEVEGERRATTGCR